MSGTATEASDVDLEASNAAEDWEPVPKAPEPVLGDECDQPLKSWGVTRRFDFGQFVLLQTEGKLNGKTTAMPLVVAPSGAVYGENEGSDDAAPSPEGDASASTAGGASSRRRFWRRSAPMVMEPGSATIPAAPSPELLPPDTIAAAAGGVPLEVAFAAGDRAVEVVTSRPLGVRVEDVTSIIDGEPVEVGGQELYPRLGTMEAAALWAGRSVTVVATDEQGDSPTVVRLVPQVVSVNVDDDALDAVLAGRPVGSDAAADAVFVDTTREVTSALLSGSNVVTPGLVGNTVVPVRLTFGATDDLAGFQPAARTCVIHDAAGFFVNPVIPSLDGRPMAVPLTEDLASALRREGVGSAVVGGRSVELRLGPEAVTNPGDVIGLTPDPLDGNGFGGLPGLPGIGGSPLDNLDLKIWWFEFMGRRPGFHGDGGPGVYTAPGTTTPGSKPGNIPRPKGLQVAVFLPWRQEWTLAGFSRGNLISSVALAPGEDVTIRVSQWERRSKALEQLAETETDITADFMSTTRDTEDVFREMTSSQEFQAQASASVDASYSPGVASIQVGIDGSLTSGSNVAAIARSAQQHMQETVRRATTRVRSRRITKITEQVESGRSEDVVRHIRNNNRCHSLTLDYHERLAHYTVATRFVPERVRVVVMVENPLRTTNFTSLLVRSNETALRNSLLNEELADAFAACRLLASYRFAWTEAEAIAAKSKIVAELDRERTKQQPAGGGAPTEVKTDPPQLKSVIAALQEIRKAATLIVAGDYNAAFKEIATPPANRASETNRQSAKRWLFRTLVENKLGASLVTKMREISNPATALTVDYARTWVDAVPTTYPGLSDLAGLKDTEKEDAGLAVAIKQYYGWFGNWAWFTGQVRDQGMYNPDDAGFVAGHKRLTSAMRDYEAKASEGDALLSQQQMVASANQEQAAANWVDKLEMKYGLEVVADAMEREQALMAHLNEHADYYRFVLFQALPPGEQLKLLTELAPQLKIGFFEPRVVANNGPLLALPLTPVGETALAKLVKNLRDTLKKASDEAAAAQERMLPDDYILPTPGMTVVTTLGKCTGCGPHEEKMLEIEADKARAEADILTQEARRRELRLDNELYDDPIHDDHHHPGHRSRGRPQGGSNEEEATDPNSDDE